MTFLDTLREHLQEILERPAHASGPALSALAPAAIRSHLIRCLERLEEQDRAAGETGIPDYEGLLNHWQEGDAVVRFAERMEHLLREGMSRQDSPEELFQQIKIALARQLGLPDKLPSRIRTLELDRLSSIAQSEAFMRKWDAASASVDAYAAAIRATRRTGASLSLLPIGRVFLEFTGRDAIRWLLHVEVAQSTGPGDDWRMSRETAQALVRKTDWVFTGWQHLAFPHSWATLARLEALGLVSIPRSRRRRQSHSIH